MTLVALLLYYGHYDTSRARLCYTGIYYDLLYRTMIYHARLQLITLYYKLISIIKVLQYSTTDYSTITSYYTNLCILAFQTQIMRAVVGNFTSQESDFLPRALCTDLSSPQIFAILGSRTFYMEEWDSPYISAKLPHELQRQMSACCIHTYIHTYMHTYIHTYMHAYIHTYIHII